jgi:hypothetical protein
MSEILYKMDDTIESDGLEFNFVDVGINENLELVGISYETSKNGNEFLSFSFKDEDGKTLTHTEWKPTDLDPMVLQNKILNQMKRVRHIATKFVSNTEFTFTSNSFEDFSKKVISILENKFTGVKIRCKVVYNNSNFTTLPNYIPFMELMSIPKENTKLRISSIDKMVKTPKVTNIPSNENVFATGGDVNGATSEVVTNNSPF